MPHLNLTRRSLLRNSALGAATMMVGNGLVGQASAAGEVVLGAVYVGPRDDFGWNQAHAVAMEILKKVPNVKVLEEENVAETDAVSKSMESMINIDGANLILGTSFGYFDPFMIDLAKKYPNVQFRHAAPLWNKDKHPMNLGGYFCYLNQAHYVDGVAGRVEFQVRQDRLRCRQAYSHCAVEYQLRPARRPLRAA